jgi:hypothetical protein
MSVFFHIVLFFLGVYLSIRLMAALYGILDFRYIIKTAYPRVIRGILIWGGIPALLVLILPGGSRAPFLWGLAVPFIFNVLSVCLYKVIAAVAIRTAKKTPART